MNAIKVASFDCASSELLKDLSKSKFKTILCINRATFDSEILRAKQILKKETYFVTLYINLSYYA